MGFLSGDKDKTASSASTGRTSAGGGNGNARDTSNPDGAKHAAALGPHMAAVNDLRPASGHIGRHRGEA